MKKDELFKNIGTNGGKSQKPDGEDPDGPEEERDPRIAQLIEEGMRAIEQLDPIVREKFRDDPAALAEWDEIMHMCDDLEEDDPGGGGAS